MDALMTRSPNYEAIQAELHRSELLREAAASRLARAATSSGTRSTHGAEAGLVSRIRAAFGSVGQPVQPDCPECA